MDKTTRDKYMALISQGDTQKKLEALAQKIGKRVVECLDDILTLTVTTRYQGNDTIVAKTALFFDGDIEIILPKDEENKLDQVILDIHQKTVELAMQNRRELIKILIELLDLKEILPLI